MSSYRSSNCAVWLKRILLAVHLVRSLAQEKCFDCSKYCDRTDDDCYSPQKCSNDCADWTKPNVVGGEDTIPNRLANMEKTVQELQVMTCILLALMIILLLGMTLLFLHITKRFSICLGFSSILHGRATAKDLEANKDRGTQQKHHLSNGTVPNGTISRIVNHNQSSSSPHTQRTVFNTPSTLGNTDLEPVPRANRVRQPSESTCPDESTEVSPEGYDNLALSTSTINTSSSTVHNTSSETLGGIAISTNTLQTTLDSDAHLSNATQNTRV